MDKLQKSNPSTSLQDQSTVLSEKVYSIARLIFELNLILPYPLEDVQIEDWSKTIDRILPDLDISQLRHVIDLFITGEFVYDKNLGITNIFTALKKTDQEPDLVYY